MSVRCEHTENIQYIADLHWIKTHNRIRESVRSHADCQSFPKTNDNSDGSPQGETRSRVHSFNRLPYTAPIPTILFAWAQCKSIDTSSNCVNVFLSVTIKFNSIFVLFCFDIYIFIVFFVLFSNMISYMLIHPQMKITMRGNFTCGNLLSGLREWHANKGRT